MSVLYYLVGLPGAGKSYYAQQLRKENPDCVYLSSDEIRKELYGDENCQDNPSQVFDLMLRRTIQALKSGDTVIYDATNVVRRNRMNVLKSIGYLKNVDIIKKCCVIWAPIETCIERDSKRERNVGERVIWKMVKRFQTPWYDEGWNEIKIIKDEKDGYLFSDFNLDIPHDNPHHPNTIIEHTANVVSEVQKLKDDVPDVMDYLNLTEMAFWHDVGKIFTKGFANKKGEATEIAHYYDHQNVSAYICLGEKFKGEESRLRVSYLVNMHMEPFFNESGYFKNMDPKLKKLVLLFNECDRRGA